MDSRIINRYNIMIVIQSFNTFGGARMTGGYATSRVLQAELSARYETHKQWDYQMFTDRWGARLLRGIVPVTVMDFPVIAYDKLVYAGKFQAQAMIHEPYVHVDLDATLRAMPNGCADVYCERLDYRQIGRETIDLGINTKGVAAIPCSALIGFTDMAFRDMYLSEVFSKIETLAKMQAVNYRHAWAIEEVLLAGLIRQHSKTVQALQCEHLHSIKSI